MATREAGGHGGDPEDAPYCELWTKGQWAEAKVGPAAKSNTQGMNMATETPRLVPERPKTCFFCFVLFLSKAYGPKS